MLDALSAELLPERFPLSLLLGHELHKFRRLPDPIQKMIAGKERIVGKAGRRGFFQPFDCLGAVAGKRVYAGSVISPMMTTRAVVELSASKSCRDSGLRFGKVSFQSKEQGMLHEKVIGVIGDFWQSLVNCFLRLVQVPL